MASLEKVFPQQVDECSVFFQYSFYLILAVCMCILEEEGHRKYDNCCNSITPVITVILVSPGQSGNPHSQWFTSLHLFIAAGSSWSVQALSGRGEQASHRSGSSCCRAQALEHGLNGCGVWPWSLRDMSDLPGPGIEPASPALTRGLFTPGPPGQPSHWFLNAIYRCLMQTIFYCQGWQTFL